MSLIDRLLPGDVLLYKPTGFFGLLISIKTWNAISHCESYVGLGKSVASRDGKGVAIYDLREKDLALVLRPVVPFDQALAQAWFLKEANGQGYDWLGLLRFTWRSDYCKGNTNNKQFCSEFLTRYYRSGLIDFFPGADADAIAPCFFASNPLLRRIDITEPSASG